MTTSREMLDEIRRNRARAERYNGADDNVARRPGIELVGTFMQVFIPTELAGLEVELKRFIDAMAFKLRKNSHKGKWEAHDLQTILALLGKEVEELKVAILEKNSVEILLEAADVANFAMIAAALAIAGKQ